MKLTIAKALVYIFDFLVSLFIAIYGILIGPPTSLRGTSILEKTFYYFKVLLPLDSYIKALKLPSNGELANLHVAIGQIEQLICKLEKDYT